MTEELILNQMEDEEDNGAEGEEEIEESEDDGLEEGDEDEEV